MRSLWLDRDARPNPAQLEETQFMATEDIAEAAPSPSTAEALMAERQVFWARFCRVAVWAVVIIASLLVVLDWSLL